MSYFDNRSKQIVLEDSDLKPVKFAQKTMNSIMYGNPEGSVFASYPRRKLSEMTDAELEAWHLRELDKAAGNDE